MMMMALVSVSQSGARNGERKISIVVDEGPGPEGADAFTQIK
jgi:hypothetical protein